MAKCPYCQSTKIEKKTNIKFKSEDLNALTCGACGKEVRQFGGMLPCINDFLRMLHHHSQTQEIKQVKIGDKSLPVDEAGIYSNYQIVRDLPPHHVTRVGHYFIDIFKLNDVLNKEFCL